MAFNGSLVSVGGYSIPLKLIKNDTYTVTYSTQDLDSYRDLDGKLHRNALSNKVGKVEFETPYLEGKDLMTLMSGIKSGYTSALEKKASVTFYNPEDDNYITQDMYVPDIKFKMYKMQDNGDILYSGIRIAFIGY